MGQFRDYYLVKTLIAVGAVIFLAALIRTMTRPQEVNLLSIYVFDDIGDPDRTDAFCEKMREILKAEDKYETVTFSSGLSPDKYQDMMILQVHAVTRDLDVIIAGEESFRKLAAAGYLESFEEAFGDSLSELPAERLVTANGPAEVLYAADSAEETAESTDGDGAGEEKIYGLSIEGSAVWEDLSLTSQSDFIAGVGPGTENQENILTFFSTILG